MAIEAELPTTEEVNNTESNFLSNPGTYHFAVMSADENPTYRGGDKKGQMMDGFEIEAAVQAGPEKGKSHRFFVRNPNLSHKDQGVFCKALRGKWLEAIAVVDPSQRGKTVTIELVNGNGQVLVMGRQFIATMEANKGQNDKSYLDLAGAKVWHVDDPNADKCERNQAALSPNIYPPKFRRDPSSFKQNGNGNGTANKAPAQQQQTAPAGGGVNLDDV
jgi:hypothetical protein